MTIYGEDRIVLTFHEPLTLMVKQYVEVASSMEVAAQDNPTTFGFNGQNYSLETYERHGDQHIITLKVVSHATTH